MGIIDIEEVCKVAKSYGIPVVVDNTFATPYNQRPLSLGADISLHSLTKGISGHSSLLAGAVIGSNDMIARLMPVAKDLGATLSPQDASDIILGSSTLALRCERQNENAQYIAEFLESHKKVDRVYYPGLKSHPQHAIAKKQMLTPYGTNGYGCMMNIRLKGDENTAKDFLNHLAQNSFIGLEVSLGSIHTYVQCAYLMTHAPLSAQEKASKGIFPTDIRLSAGIEHKLDICDAIEDALCKC
jgi:cystathionine beta-lyase/cystathionine gamma-synthase